MLGVLGTLHTCLMCDDFPCAAACIGLCPHGLDALSLEDTRPALDAERCVGCGLCIDSCPTMPNAFELLPLTRDDEESVGRAGPV